MTNPPPITRLIRLHGRVQGVYFRESMCMKAAELGVTGWVRNRRDGTVEAMIQGDDEAVSRMLAWARRGPEMAAVTQMDVEEASDNFDGFTRRETT